MYKLVCQKPEPADFLATQMAVLKKREIGIYSAWDL